MCEVKCGASALGAADRSNAHSVTLVARGVVNLFRLVGRKDKVHQEILAFSISHDYRLVRINGYYPMINEKDTKYYRHPIHTLNSHRSMARRSGPHIDLRTTSLLNGC